MPKEKKARQSQRVRFAQASFELLSQQHLLKRIIVYSLDQKSNAQQWLNLLLVCRCFTKVATLPTVKRLVERLLLSRQLSVIISKTKLNYCKCALLGEPDRKRVALLHKEIQTHKGFRIEGYCGKQIVYEVVEQMGERVLRLFGNTIDVMICIRVNSAWCSSFRIDTNIDRELQKFTELSTNV